MNTKKVLSVFFTLILFLCSVTVLVSAESKKIIFGPAGVSLQNVDKPKFQKDAANTDSQIIEQLKAATKIDTTTYGPGLREKILGDSSNINK